MTDSEYAAEWPFTINSDEIRLCRSMPHHLDNFFRDERGKLMQQRAGVDHWLGYFEEPKPIHTMRRLVWKLIGRRIYEQVRSPVICPSNEEDKNE